MSSAIPTDPKLKLVGAIMAVRAMSPPIYNELIEAMEVLERHYEKRAIQAGIADGGISIGFARGVTEVLKTIREAPTLHAQTTTRS